MSPLTPLGTARRRFATERGDPVEGEALFGDLDDLIPAYLGWEIARCAVGLPPHEQSAVAALAAACVTSVRAGSTRLPLDDARLPSLLAAAGASHLHAAVARVLQGALSHDRHPAQAVLGRPGDRRPLIVDGEWLYTERMRVLEDRFCDRVRDRLGLRMSVPDPRALGRALAAVADRARLTDEQKSAVRDALRLPLTLITGGPGTGKTTTVVSIVRAVAWLGVPPIDSVAIAAPTGKAAQRLADAIAASALAPSADMSDAALPAMVPPPLTLHRLLGWSPSRGRFARHENDPLPQRLIIVDEASMIDLAVMERLLRALRPDARLVLLGDADQLPSVEAGAVFRDLCAGLKPARLRENLRVASDPAARGIIAAAVAINRGALDASFRQVVARRTSVNDLEFRGVEHLDGAWTDVGEALLERWWGEQLAADEASLARARRVYQHRDGLFEPPDASELAALFAHHRRHRCLCVTRTPGVPTSSDTINERLLQRLGGQRWRTSRFARSTDFAPGTPVIAQRNDYGRGLFNGDQGVVVRVDRGDGDPATRMAVFQRGAGFVAFPAAAVPDLAPAFALTVHKAQGSEFDHVLLVLPDDDMPLLSRELVYTAVTRARRSVLIAGRHELLARAVSHTVQRFSGVADRLAAP